jgi:hypothetical protein
MKKTIRPIRKKLEFLAFLKTLKDGTNAHWQEVAEAIGIDNTTITYWKKYPEAKKARREGIKKALEGMVSSGHKDWRMWESKLKMLGIIPKEKSEVDLKSDGLPIPILGNKVDVLFINNGNKKTTGTD